MKIAIASDGKYVSGHFGHCEGFTIYEVEEGKSLNKNFTPNPGHRPGYLPVFLKGLNVDVILQVEWEKQHKIYLMKIILK